MLKALNAVDFSTLKTRKEAEAVLNGYISDAGTKQFLLKNIYWKQDELMAWRFNLEVITRHYDEILLEVPQKTNQVATMIMRGERSNYISDEDLLDMKKRFPNSELVTIKDAGHWVHAEKPKEFFEAVMDFIAN